MYLDIVIKTDNAIDALLRKGGVSKASLFISLWIQ